MTQDQAIEVLAMRLIMLLTRRGRYQTNLFRAQVVCLNGERLVGISLPPSIRRSGMFPLNLLFGLGQEAWRQFDTADEHKQAQLMGCLERSLPQKLEAVFGLQLAELDINRLRQASPEPRLVRFERFV